MASTWTYGSSASAHNIDKLVTAACSGAACAGGGYSRTYLYDSLGRPSRVTIAIGSSSWYTTTSYDGVTGQKASVRAFSGFTLNSLYSARGYLSSMVDGSTLQTYWSANARDAELHLTQSTAGNGVVTNQGYDATTGRVVAISAGTSQSLANLSYDWDPVGNLLQRTDMLAVSGGETESFCYDALNRVVKVAMAGTCGTVATEAYNNAGSLTMKADVCSTANCFVYNTTQPHALASITGGTVNGVSNPTFTYDANGNMLTGAGRTVTYTSFNMASSIVEGSTSVTLTYDPEHQRIDQGVSLNGGATTTTAYLNDPDAGVLSENIHIPSVSNSYKTYIMADGKIVAQRTTVNGSSVVDMKYFVLDHLGSIAAITDGNKYLSDGVTLNPAYGTVIERDAYDAWGKARLAATGADDTTCLLPTQSKITRGYTGQEEMPSVCLVNYNARIYDPAIGKFMSADDVIPDAYNGQSYNRYTYVDDNPLSYDDPTGHTLGDVGNNFQPFNYDWARANDTSCVSGCNSDFDQAAAIDFEVNAIAHTVSATLAQNGQSSTGITVSYSGGQFNVTVPGATFTGTDLNGKSVSGNTFGIFASDIGRTVAIGIDMQNAGSSGAKFVAYGASGSGSDSQQATTGGSRSLAGYPGITVNGDSQGYTDKAIDYLKGYSGTDSVLRTVSDKGGTIDVGANQIDRTVEGNDGHWTIYWDPLESLVDLHGQSISPALALFHEFGHATLSAADLQGLQGQKAGQGYENMAEYQAMTQFEHQAALALHEGMRTTHIEPPHEPDQFHVAGPTERWQGSLISILH